VGRRAPTLGSDHPRAKLVRGAEGARADEMTSTFDSLSPSRHLATPTGCGNGGKTKRAGCQGDSVARCWQLATDVPMVFNAPSNHSLDRRRHCGDRRGRDKRSRSTRAAGRSGIGEYRVDNRT
jgi:hypothetical protein